MSVAVASNSYLTDRETTSYNYFYMLEEGGNIEEEKGRNRDSDESSSQSFSEMIKMTREPGISMFE